MGIAGSMLEATSMAVITGWIFLQLDGSLSGIRSREGALYTAASLRKTFSGILRALLKTSFRVTGPVLGASRLSTCHSPSTACYPSLYLRTVMLTPSLNRRLSHSPIRMLPPDC